MGYINKNTLKAGNVLPIKISRTTSVIRAIALSLFLSFNCAFWEENQANAQNIKVIDSTSLSQKGEWTMDEAWNYVLDFEEAIYLPEAKYNIRDMESRMRNYPFLGKFSETPLPIDAGQIMQEIISNNLAEIGSPQLGFIRDEAIYLITMSRVEHELVDLANAANDIFRKNKKFTENILVNNEDIFSLIQELEKVKSSIAAYDSTGTTQTVQSLKERKLALEKEIMTEKAKRNGYQEKLVDSVCSINKRCSELLGVIAELQERLESPVYRRDYTAEQQKLLEQEHKSTKDLYTRINMVFSKTFRRGGMMSDQIGGNIEKLVLRAEIVTK